MLRNNSRTFEDSWDPWLGATVGSALVGLSGVLPCLFFGDLEKRPSSFRFLLSFAVGGLLGDTFLHILPESYNRSPHEGTVGTIILIGLLLCVFVEILSKTPSVSGYSNLIANALDNLNHGLSVGGAFTVSNQVGILTTFCVLLHEIPHEVGDFAILLKSGFTPVQAAKAQFVSAFLGVAGALIALIAEKEQEFSSWILPFTAGGFLNIALVSVLPDLMKPNSFYDSFLTIMGIGVGIYSIYLTDTATVTSSIEIVKLCSKNRADFKNLCVILFPVSYMPSFFDELIRGQTKKGENCVGYIAYLRCKPVGIVAWSENLDKKQVHILNLGVLILLRHRGIGTRLFNLIPHDNKTISLYVQVSNEDAQGFYVAKGFKKIRLEKDFYNRLESNDAYYMERSSPVAF